MEGTRRDDFWEISDLLLGARDRYRSARARVRLSVDAAVARESNRRFVDWNFAQPGGPSMGIIGKPGPPVPEDFYHEYEDAEDELLLWYESPTDGERSGGAGRATGRRAGSGRR